jgi:hypothetical protein
VPQLYDENLPTVTADSEVHTDWVDLGSATTFTATLDSTGDRQPDAYFQFTADPENFVESGNPGEVREYDVDLYAQDSPEQGHHWRFKADSATPQGQFVRQRLYAYNDGDVEGLRLRFSTP